MYQAFSDDSMSGEGEHTLLLAACVQRMNVWANFLFDFEAALAAPPSINYFKMREARALIGEFSGWKQFERDEKIRQLSRVIAAFDIKTIFAWVSRKEFDEIVKPIIPYMIRHPYIPLFYALIIKLAHWQHSAGITLPTDFIFDEQGIIGAESVVWYGIIKHWQPAHYRKLMGKAPVFADDKLVLQLQAADLVAWHHRRLIDNPTENISAMPTAVLSNIDRAGVHLKREYLTTVAQHMASVPYVELTKDKPKGYHAPDPSKIEEYMRTPEEYEKIDRVINELMKVSPETVRQKIVDEQGKKLRGRGEHSPPSRL